MNIIKERQEQRLKKISQMKRSIKKAKNPDYKLLVMKCCAMWGMSKRTVEEYLEHAKYELKHGI